MSRLDEHTTHDQTSARPAVRERGPHISVLQVIASALAALSASVIASFAGVAGTVLGAAVVSVVATVAAALYSYSFRWVRSQVSVAPRPEGPRVDTERRSDQGLSSQLVAAARGVAVMRNGLIQLRWRRVAIAALGAFVLAMTAVTLIELATRGPISSHLPGGHARGGTSIGDLFAGGGSSPSPTPPTVPAPAPETTTTTSPVPSAPSSGPSTTSPTSTSPGSTSPASTTSPSTTTTTTGGSTTTTTTTTTTSSSSP